MEYMATPSKIQRLRPLVATSLGFLDTSGRVGLEYIGYSFENKGSTPIK